MRAAAAAIRRRATASTWAVWALLALAVLLTLRGDTLMVAGVAWAALCVWAVMTLPELTLIALYVAALLPRELRNTPLTIDGNWPGLRLGLQPADIVFFAMLAAVVLVAAAPRHWIADAVDRPGLPAWVRLVALGFAAWVAIGVLRNVGESGLAAVGEFKARYLVYVVPVYMALFLRDRATVKRALGMLIVFTVYGSLALLPVIGALKGWSVGPESRFYHSDVSFGLLLGTVALVLAWRKGIFIIPGVIVVTTVLLAAALVFVDSHRSVWIAGMVLALALMLLGEVRLSRFWRWGPALLVVALIAAASAFAWGIDPGTYVAERAAAYVAPSEDANSAWRIAIWKQEILSLRDAPVAGRGFGGYWSLYVPEIGGQIVVAPHNLYIMTAVKLGLVGMALLIALMTGIGIYLLRQRKTPRARYDPVIGFPIAYGAAVMAALAVYFVVYHDDWFAILWVGLGLAAAVCADGDGRPPEPGSDS